MAKSMRSKRVKRLRALRREIVEPFYDKKDAAKLAVQEAALAAPRLPVRSHNSNDADAAAMELTTSAAAAAVTASATSGNIEVEMADASMQSLKPIRKIGKKLSKKIKLAKKKHRGGKGKIRKKHNV